MKKLEQFIENLCGSFNNNGQIDRELAAGEVIHPKAKHINGVCNNKIKNLPKNFNGYFVIEESYYEQGKFTNILPHLFLLKKMMVFLREKVLVILHLKLNLL